MENLDIDKYYGFYFCGERFKRELSQTYLPVDQMELEHLLSEAVSYSRGVAFKVLFGFVKELTMYFGKVSANSPSKVGGEKYQAFIFKRKTDEVKGQGEDYFLNGTKIDFNFIQYNVNIVEVDD